MSVIGWLILGLIAGFIASKIVNKSGEGVLLDVVLGIVGGLSRSILIGRRGSGHRPQHLQHGRRDHRCNHGVDPLSRSRWSPPHGLTPTASKTVMHGLARASTTRRLITERGLASFRAEAPSLT